VLGRHADVLGVPFGLVVLAGHGRYLGVAELAEHLPDRLVFGAELKRHTPPSASVEK
jgi:hypothetical protein